MSFDKQIQDKFSGFEPEVPEEQIDAGWEKIRYFLPQQETKKRAFFWYWSVKGMGIAAVVVLISAIGFLWLNQEQSDMIASATRYIKPVPRSVNLKSGEIQEAALKPESEKKPETSSVPAMQQFFKTTVAVKHAGSSRTTKADLSASAIPYSKNNTGISNGMTKPVRHTSHQFRADSLPQAMPTASTELSTETLSSSAGFITLLKRPSIGQAEPFNPDPDMVLLSTDQLVILPPIKKRPSLEFFSGFNQRTLMYRSADMKHTIQANGFSAGMAANLPLTSKWYLSGQFMFNYHPATYREETGANAIVKRQVVPSNSISLSNYKDTLVSYVPYQSSFELESATAYHLSGGAGYQLLNKGKISLEAALFLDLRYMRVTYSISRINSDTGIFVNNILTRNAASFYESVEKSAGPMPVSGKKQVMALGLNPSISLLYQLTERTGLVLRPAYLFQITPNTLNINAKAYRINENNWYLNLGLRYRL